MPSSFLASASSSASSPLPYLIPARPPPPLPPSPPPLAMGQGYSAASSGGVVVPASAVVSAAAVAPPRQLGTGRGTGPGHPPLPRPPPRQCPRCGSANTKFCYYNNYSRAQPRYLCRACRRHWTEGGTLRDVPVGGGRKNRRAGKAAAAAKASASASAAPQSADAFPDLLRQLVHFQPAVGGYGIDLALWQQMAASATAPPQGATGDVVGALGGTTTVHASAAAAEANCGALQYWGGWQQDDMPNLDGAC